MKRIIMLLLGCCGACMVWPCLLTIQYFQPVFPGYLSFSLTQGIMLGLVFGAIFGSFEGIVVSSRTKAIKGLLFGAVAGVLSGAFGVFAGQAFLFGVADSLQRTEQSLTGIPLILANSMGWVIIGLCISLIEGFRSRSLRKLLVGLAGGIVGGSLGGMLLQLSVIRYPGNQTALLVGLVVFGFSSASSIRSLKTDFHMDPSSFSMDRFGARNTTCSSHGSGSGLAIPAISFFPDIGMLHRFMPPYRLKKDGLFSVRQGNPAR